MRVFIILMLICSQCLADELDKIPKADKVMILNRGQPAPFSGIFMTQDQFRFYETTVFERDMLAKDISECPKPIAPPVLQITLVAVASALATLAITSAVRYK